MEISSKLPGVDLAQLQSARPPQRVGQDSAGLASNGGGASSAESDVRVSISAEARAADEIGRAATLQQTVAVTAPAAPEEAEPVSAPESVARGEAPVSASATQPGDTLRAAAPESGLTASRPAETAAAVAQQGSGRRAPEPDAPSAANSQAVQLYLENASRTNSQPAVAPIRASA